MEQKQEEKKVAIAVKDVKKVYKLYEKPSDRLKETFGDTEKFAYGELPPEYDENGELIPVEEPDTILYLNGFYTTGGIWRQLPNYYAMRDLLGMEYMSG